MAQHDYDIANQSGANFRADLNNALDAIVSNNSGSSEPSTTFAYEWWIDTSANVLKLRNSANNAWITLPLSITADNSTSGALTVNGNLTTTGSVDINGQELILDADADTSITADTDDQIDFKIGGTDVATLTNSHLVLKGTTPKITIGDGGEEDTALIFDGNAQDFYIGLDDSADDLLIGTGSTVGSNAKVVIENGGSVAINSATADPLSLAFSGTGLALNEDSGTAFMQIDGGNGSRIDFGISGSRFSTLYSDANVLELGRTSNHPIAFKTNNTERIRITNDGKIGIGTTAPDEKLQVNGKLKVSSSFGTGTAVIIQNNDSSSNFSAAAFYSGGTLAGYIFVNGSTNSTTYATSSDYRLKENINYEFDALDRVKQLKPARFNFIADETNTLVDGFIAHEVSDLVPEAVTGEKDGELMQGIDQSKLVPLLTKAIQELEARVKILEE